MKIYLKIFYFHIVILLLLNSNFLLYANHNEISYTKLVDKAVTFSNLNYVFELIEDNEYIWAATFGGVVKFDKDGNLLKCYTISDGLVNNNVRSINIDHEGNKWFSCWQYGVSMFDGTDWKLFNYDNTSYFIDYVQKIRISNDGSILFSEWGGNVALFKNDNWIIIEPEENLDILHLYDALYDRKNNLWLASHNGVFKYDGNKWERMNVNASSLELDLVNGDLWFADDCMNHCTGVSKYDGTNWIYYSDSDGLINNCVSSIAIEPNGNKWFGSRTGVSKYDEVNNKWTTYTQVNNIIIEDVNDIIIDSEGNKWFGTNTGIIKFDNTSWKFYTFKNSSPIFNVDDVAKDNKGNIWATHQVFSNFNSHSKNYLSKYDGTEWKLTKQFELEGNFFHHSISIDSHNKFWFFGNLTYSNPTIISYDGLVWKKFTSANGLAFNNIYDLKIDFEDNVWVASSNSVAMYNGNNWKTFNSSLENLDTEFDEVNRIAIDTNGSVWFLKYDIHRSKEKTTFGIGELGVNFILYEYKNQKWYKYKKYELNGHNIFRVVFRIDNDNTKWIVTNCKILKFDGKNWEIIETPPYNISTLEIDNKGIKWFGTYGNGLLKLVGSKWTEYKTSCGLHSNDVKDIVTLDSGEVIAASNYAISKLISVPLPKADINEDGNVDVKDILNVMNLLSYKIKSNTRRSLKSVVTNKYIDNQFMRSDIDNNDQIGLAEAIFTMQSISDSCDVLASGCGVSAAVQKGQWIYYKIITNSSDTRVSFDLTFLSNDVDMYIKKGKKPTLNDYDSRPVKDDTWSESCSMENSGVNTWYIGVYGNEGGVFSIKAIIGQVEGWASVTGFREADTSIRDKIVRMAIDQIGSPSGQSTVTGSLGWLTDIYNNDGARMRDAITLYHENKTNDQIRLLMIKAFNDSEYEDLHKEILTDRIIEVYNNKVPQDDEETLQYLGIQKQCLEWVMTIAHYAGGAAKNYKNIGASVPNAKVRPGMGYYNEHNIYPHAMIIIDVYHDRTGNPIKLRVAESNYCSNNCSWSNPTGQVPWERIIGKREVTFGYTIVNFDKTN